MTTNGGVLLAVFHEFAVTPDHLAKIRAVVPVDVAPQPNPLAKTPEEIAILSRNAKLFFPPSTPAVEIDALLEQLAALGLDVVHRNPVTSAGCAMRDRVILILRQA